MGIYSNGKVYGVGWIRYNDSDEITICFEKIFEDKMSILQIQEVKMAYDLIPEDQRNNMSIRFYTSCSSTYDDGTFMTWFPGNTYSLKEFFLKGDIRI